jgi:hypothetical protein
MTALDLGKKALRAANSLRQLEECQVLTPAQAPQEGSDVVLFSRH